VSAHEFGSGKVFMPEPGSVRVDGPRRFIVKVDRGYHGPDYTDEYLTALQHNPYQRPGGERSHTTSSEQSEAFRFRTRAAAEVAAVYVGGRVVRLVKKGGATESHPVAVCQAEERLAGLRKLCGYVENGSSNVVTICQDDATRAWVIRTSNNLYDGDTFEQAIDNAINGETK
jgi:hypothetical protein